MIPGEILADRFLGCLLGLAVGDALGGRFEAQSAEHVRSRFPSVGLMELARGLFGRYQETTKPPASR
ncbi:MAG TPA: ADP-ribosylglycohydrolase family protein [Gemmataceae bacterium]